MGASESAPEKPAEAASEKPEAEPTPPRRKVVLKVRMHSLGHGRMDLVSLEVTCPADMRAGVVLSKLASAKKIQEPGGFTAFGTRIPVGAYGPTAGELVEETDSGWHLEVFETRDDPAHDLYKNPLQHGPIEEREGFEALIYAVLHLQPDRVAALLPAFDATVDYGRDGWPGRFTTLSDLLVLVSGPSPISVRGEAHATRRLEIVKLFCAAPGIDLGAYPKLLGQWNAPQEAAPHGFLAIVDALLEAGAPDNKLRQLAGNNVEMLKIIERHEVVITQVQTAEERSAESRKRAEREGSVIEIDDEEPVPRVTPRKKAKKRRSRR